MSSRVRLATAREPTSGLMWELAAPLPTRIEVWSLTFSVGELYLDPKPRADRIVPTKLLAAFDAKSAGHGATTVRHLARETVALREAYVALARTWEDLAVAIERNSI